MLTPQPLIFIEKPSPNFTKGRGKVRFLILHYTVLTPAEVAIEKLCNPQSKVSAHYVVGEDGKIYRLVSEDDIAWHAGVSYFDGRRNLNRDSIGIEICNSGADPFPQVQMDAVITLSKQIMDEHGIDMFGVLAHSDIAPARKQDPGIFFNWPQAAKAGVGVWSFPGGDSGQLHNSTDPQLLAADVNFVPEQRDIDQSSKWSNADFKKGLIKYGYDPDVDLATLTIAFQRHFQRHVFTTAGLVPGIVNAESRAILACLLRLKANA